MGKKGDLFLVLVELKGEPLPQKKVKRAPLGNKATAAAWLPWSKVFLHLLESPGITKNISSSDRFPLKPTGENTPILQQMGVFAASMRSCRLRRRQCHPLHRLPSFAREERRGVRGRGRRELWRVLRTSKIKGRQYLGCCNDSAKSKSLFAC